MNTESKTTGLDNLVSTLERVLAKFDEIDRKMATLHEELDYVMEELVVSKAEIRQTCDTIRNMESMQVQGEELHEKVSSTFQNLFSQMSQIVNAAREGLLERGGSSQDVISEIPAVPAAEASSDIEPALEQLKTETDEPLIEESQPEPELADEDGHPSTEEVHETLKEVAQTLVEEQNSFNHAVPETGASEEGTVEEEPQKPSPLAELNNLLADTEKEVTQELLGENDKNTELHSDVPIASEPPKLLKETLSKIGAGSFCETADGIATEDLGQEPEGPPSAEMNELLKSISSTYVAGNPE